MGGMKFSSWVRGPVLKAVCLQCISLVAFGKVTERGGKGIAGNVTHAIIPTFYLCGKRLVRNEGRWPSGLKWVEEDVYLYCIKLFCRVSS